MSSTTDKEGNGDYPQLSFEARPKHLREQIRSRLSQFIGGHYSSQNLSSVLYTHRLDAEENVKMTYWSPGHAKPNENGGDMEGFKIEKPGFEEAKRMLNARGKVARKGMEFGPSWTNHWFKITLKIPAAWRDYERVQFEFDTSSEALIFTPEGSPIHGLTGGFGIERRVEHIIPERFWKPKGSSGVYEIYVEGSCNGLFGIDNMDPPDPNRYYRLNSTDLVVPNMEAWHLMWDFKTLHQLTESLPWDSPLTNRALYVANEIMNAFDPSDLKSLKRCRELAEGVLGDGWEGKVEQARVSGEDKDGTLWGVGHCHIDTAWLWPFSVTQQKSARSWSTQIDLMERYPEHRFSCTQAQQYKWLEQLYPLLYRRLKAKVETGQFQPVGATWVEMDTNMPSGEALCRQFLYGQRYFKSRFGIISPTFVLPDTFGYSSQLPQIARLSGCDNFFTQKLSWNSINNFPHSTFNWVGLDGSQMLTHMTPVNSYNAQCNIDEIRRGQTGNKNLEVTKQALILFGNGDGGGGPTPPMLEKLRRARALVQCGEATSTDIPLVKMGGSFDRFFESVKKETNNGTKLPNWHGELYFELHRGTYTTQALVKRGNRKGELLLREVEYAATVASLREPQYSYPKKELDEAWEELLLCQFHDCLPGRLVEAGIRLIYDDVWAKHRKVMEIGAKLLETAYQVLHPGTLPVADDDYVPIYDRAQLVVVDPLRIARRELVSIKCGNKDVFKAGKNTAYNDKTATGYLLSTPRGFERGTLGNTCDLAAIQNDSKSCRVFNGTIKLEIKDGRIVSLFDIQLKRELIPEGQTGGFIIYEDQPANWDAWDVDVYHLEKFTRLRFDEIAIVEQGLARVCVEGQTRFGSSRMTVKITLDAATYSAGCEGRSPLRFDVKVDWRERHKFLKFELPLDIHSDFATYHTQFGIVRRPTHRNTSWDAAKFEVCGHQFADLSEYGYGVAILNESKYGYATAGNVMTLSLLRAPTMPDADADQGEHAFAFAIYAHVGNFEESDVFEVAEMFNSPLRVRWKKDLDPKPAADRYQDPQKKAAQKKADPISFSLEGARNVALETIKRGEDDLDLTDEDHAGNHVGDGDGLEGKKTVILRLYERLGGHASVRLNVFGLNITKASMVDILERHVGDLDLEKKFSNVLGETLGQEMTYVDLKFRGFEIKTVKLELSRNDGKKDRSESVGSEDWVRVDGTLEA